jgi:hypothetical protein
LKCTTSISWRFRRGFDTYIEDWGSLLAIEDYNREIGRIVRVGAEKKCG